MHERPPSCYASGRVPPALRIGAAVLAVGLVAYAGWLGIGRMAHDRQQPRAHLIALETGKSAERAQVGVLDRIFGVVLNRTEVNRHNSYLGYGYAYSRPTADGQSG